MMGAQEQAGYGGGGMSAGPGGYSPGQAGGGARGEARRGPGVGAAILAFGILVAMTAGSLKILRERGDAAVPAGHVSVRGGSIDAIAVMSGQSFNAGTAEFKEVDAVAIMGHSVLDLRHARVSGDRPVIQAVAIMGHVEILVPPDWEIVTGDMLTAGAMRNMARHAEVENPVRVRIDGVVMMGRLDVRR